MTRRDRTLWEHLSARRLTIDGTDFALALHERDVLTVYLPIAHALSSRLAKRAGKRLLVGIAGPPGAGKTATAVSLSALLEEMGEAALVVPLDGFHYPNAYLDTHEGIGHDGKMHRLRTLKGWHTTFDGERAREALRLLRKGKSLRLPVYSRTLHDPVEAALPVGPEHRILLVEGNYLFLDAGPWRHIRELFDVRIFVAAPFEVLCAQVAERHMRGGRSKEEAWRKIAEVDRPNMEAVLPTQGYADITISGARGELRMTMAGRGGPTSARQPAY